jgi:hypothetical protein
MVAIASFQQLQVLAAAVVPQVEMVNLVLVLVVLAEVVVLPTLEKQARLEILPLQVHHKVIMVEMETGLQALKQVVAVAEPAQQEVQQIQVVCAAQVEQERPILILVHLSLMQVAVVVVVEALQALVAAQAAVVVAAAGSAEIQHRELLEQKISAAAVVVVEAEAPSAETVEAA